MPFQAIQSRRLYQQIADQLSELIDRGEFPPGSYLPPERELSKRIGVSRTSVREALIALEVNGVVRVRVGSGVEVLPRTARTEGADGPQKADPPSDLPMDPELEADLRADLDAEIPPFSLLEARRLVEPETAALAARHATDEQLGDIREAYERNVTDNRSGSHTHPGDRLFHIRIADASGNTAYALLVRHLLGHQYGPLFRRLQQLYTPDDMPRRSEREHEAVLKALERRDPDAARAAMVRHLDAVIAIFSRG